MRRVIVFSALTMICLLAAGGPRSARAASGPEGEQLFRQRCQVCHSVSPGKASRVGPSLVGVVGRKAASLPFAYSAALKSSGLTWNRDNLDRFLTAPTRMVPGTRMVIAVADPAQRTALVGYLESKR